MSNDKRIAFQPVKCTEKHLESLTPQDGYVYFTTDSQKIYLGTNYEFISMGGSSGVFYANKNLTVEDYNYPVTFSIDDFENEELPKLNDLIINTGSSTGYNGFYRVDEVLADSVIGFYLPVGGGSGGGPGGDSSSEGSLLINFNSKTPQRASILSGNDYIIYFDIVAKDASGDLVRNAGKATLKVNDKTYSQNVYNGENSFIIPANALNSAIDENTISMVVSMDVGGATEQIKSKRWYVKVINLNLKWNYDYNSNNYINADTFNLNFIAGGRTACTAHIQFDDIKIPGETYFEKFVSASEANGIDSITFPGIPSLSYGSHKCEMWLDTTLEDGTYFKTPSIFNEITFIKGSTNTILIVPYYETTATQYDTVNIPFMVYDPDTESCQVRFLVDDIPLSEEGKSYDRSLQHWPYTLNSFGSVKLSIETVNSDDKVDIYLAVKELDLDASEAAGAVFSLKANNFSTNEELQAFSQTLNGKGEKIIEFSENFDWERGGLQTEELDNGSIQKYICVRQGTTMTINYKLFEKFVSGDGKNFKICFKATNCYDYEAPVLSCYEEATKVGIKLDAQKALFSTPTYPDFSTQYCENSYIELETEIWPNREDGYQHLVEDRFLMFWVDGVPTGIRAYEHASANFTQNNPQSITIGSDNCDVYIYVIKIYERSLTTQEHLNNFIMDAPSTNEMLARYNRNDILDNTGEISYERLIQKNPQCHAYVYRVNEMTTSKDDKVSGCDYFELHDTYNTIDNPYYKAVHEINDKGVRIRVQGTSSAAYGVAAFNMRTEFQEGLIDKDGNKVDGWEVSNTAIPIDYVCTKVNVASCENANNVVNAEWYNKFQPYLDAHRRKVRADGKLYRDCMEFNSGVVFIQDDNSESNYLDEAGIPNEGKYLEANIFSDVPGYVEKPYYKMYAVGNMGNDKKNSEVFHDMTPGSNACCVEVADNQNAEHWMTKTIDMNQFNLEKPYHEFRYPDGNDKASNEQKQAWINFVKWMAEHDVCAYDEENHPYGYTGEEFETPKVFEPYTFKGFDPPGYEGEENPTGVTLKGKTISQYAGTYTHDTYEYRMANFLQDCEQHLIMDSVVFHYLFIQRHTMVDNVAKNTFWSTEDLTHWDLTRNYDNDTSDGNDNSGNLKFSYGIEVLDKKDNGSEIWNAQESIWINFIHGLSEAQQILYKQLETKGAWNASKYLAEFNKHQSIIPERCWIEDYFRKYIKPRRLGFDKKGDYLSRLEGGKKVHQRKQYETYQEFYLNSKYMAGTPFTEGAAFDLRLNANPNATDNDTWDKDAVIPISFYIDCYASSLIGGQIDQSKERVKRREFYDIPIGKKINKPSDATCYIFGGNMVQSLSGLSETYPGRIDLRSAPKLKILNIGSDKENYYNPKLDGVSVGEGSMIQELYFQNCGQEAGMGSLNLSTSVQLKKIKANGSTLKTLILADGSAVETMYLNPLNELVISNLTKLEDIQLDEDIYNTLLNVNINNCPAMDEYSYLFALKAPIAKYNFNNFIWTIKDGELDDHFVIENGKVTSIKALDKLLAANTWENYNKTTALVGTLIIDVDCGIIDEYEIYNKYCSGGLFTNLVIEYTDKVTGLNPAVEIIFMANETTNSAIHYRVLGSGETDGDSIGKLISVEGPLKEAMVNPTKNDTSDTTYTFSGYWKDKATGNRYYQNGMVENPSNATNFNDIVPTKDMVFIPIFNSETRTFEVKFHDIEGNIILQNGKESFQVPYGSTYVAAGGPLTNYYYLDSSNLADEERYGFRGWTENIYGIGEVREPEYIDLNNHIIKKALNLHPHYVIESVYTTASDSNYFNYSGKTISLKDEYKGVLQGKVTLPNTSPSGTALTIVGDFKDENNLITHIFFLENCSYEEISADAFSESGGGNKYGIGLQAVYLPLTMKIIGSNAFYGLQDLQTIGSKENNYNNITIIRDSAFRDCPNLIIQELPDNLKTLENYAFYDCKNIQVTKLPNTLILKQNYGALGQCPYVRIAEFGTQNSGQNLNWIPGYFLSGSGLGTGNIPEITQIKIGSGIKYMGLGCFNNSYASLISNIIFDDWNNIKNADGESFNSQDELLSYVGLGTSASTISIMSSEEGEIIL